MRAGIVGVGVKWTIDKSSYQMRLKFEYDTEHCPVIGVALEIRSA
jgi:hypothetical protein